MVTTEREGPGRATALALPGLPGLCAAAAAVLVPFLMARFRESVALVLVGLAGMGLTAAGVW